MSNKTDVRARLYLDNNGLRPTLMASEGMLGGFANNARLIMLGGGVAAAAGFGKGFLDGMGQQQIASKFGEEIAESSADVYRDAWGESLEDVATQMREVQAGLGDAGNIEDMTAAAFILSEKFDRDVGGTVQDVTELVESFGLKGEEAFDLWGSALEGMTDEGREELSAATREYGDFFAEMGFSAEETLGLMREFGGGGSIELDKMGDALKELTIRGTDMSASSVAAYDAVGLSAEGMAAMFLAGGEEARAAAQITIASLQSIEDPVEQSAAAIALFGTPLEDLGTSQIPEFLQSMAGMGAGFETTQGLVGELGAELSDNLGTKLEGLKRGALGALADFMEERVIPVVEDVIDVVVEHWPEISATIATVTGEIGAVIAEHWPAIQALITEVTTELGELIDEYWPVIQEVIKVVSEAIAELVAEHWPQVLEIITDVMEAVEALIERVTIVITYIWERWGDNIRTYAVNIWSNIQEAIGLALDLIQSVLGVFTALFKGDWSAMWDSIKAVLDSALGLIGLAIDNTWEAIKLATGIAWDLIKNEVWDVIKALPGVILDAAVSLAFAGKTLFTHAKNGMMEALADAAVDVLDWVRGMPAAILGLGLDLWQMGKDWFSTLADGIASALAALPGIILDLVLGPLDEVYNKVTDVLGLGDSAGKTVGTATGKGTTSGEPEDVPFGDPGAIAAFSAGGGNGALYLHDGGDVTQAMADAQPRGGLRRDEVRAVLQVGEKVIPAGGASGGPFIQEAHFHEGGSILGELETAYQLYGEVA